MKAPVRSRIQLEQSARRLLSNAFAQGLDDDEAVEFAAAAMGQDHKALIGRVLELDRTNYMGVG